MSKHEYITYSEITGQKPTESEVNVLISSLNKKAAFGQLSMINNFLALFPINSENNKFIEIQMFLTANLFDDELYKKLRIFVENISLFDRPIFHRQQILLLMKKVLLEASENGGFNFDDSREARNIIGKLCLMISDFTVTLEQEQRTESDMPHSKEGTEKVLSELLAQLLPVHELFNPPEISAALIRTHEYIQIANLYYPTTFEGKTLSSYFESFAGITLERFLQMIVAVYAALVTKQFNELIQDAANFNIRKSNYFQNLNFSEAETESFYKLTSIDFTDLCLEVETSPLRNLLQLQYDFTVFRQYPLFHLSDDILTFNDFAFLIEKASFGLYYTVVNVLQQNQIHPKTFFQNWGYIFEKYVNNIFREIYPELSNRFHPNTFYNSKQKIESFDGILEYPNALIVMQYKGGLLNATAKYNGDVDFLLKEMNEKFGTKVPKSGINQLTINIERLFNLDANRRYKILDLEFPNTRVVYPILIVNELSMEFGLAHWILRGWFEKSMESKSIAPDIKVNSLMILTIEDLELIVPYLEAGDFTLLDFAQFYSNLEYIKFSWLLIREHWYEPMTSIRDVFHKFRASQKIKFRPNKTRQDKFEKFMSEVRALFKDEIIE